MPKTADETSILQGIIHVLAHFQNTPGRDCYFSSAIAG